MKQLARFQELVASKAVQSNVLDEKDRLVSGAQAAWEGSQAKLQAFAADLAVVSSKLATARADLLVKEAQIRVARDELERARILAEYGQIRAPFDGIISMRSMDEGDFVQNASTGQARLLMTVISINKVRVALQVPERDALWLRIGTETVVHLDARGSWQVTGRVARMDHSLDSQSRTMRVEIDLENSDRKLLPGMYGQVTLVLQKIEYAYAIPATAVFSRQGENFIIIANDGIAHRQRVRIRFDDGHELEVAKLIGDKEVPLDGSEEIVVSNKGEIGQEQRVKTRHSAVESSP